MSPSSPASAVFFLWTGHSGLDADANRGRAVLEIRHPGTTTERRGAAGLIQKRLNPLSGREGNKSCSVEALARSYIYIKKAFFV